jgi:opacity protein-like surface antigen
MRRVVYIAALVTITALSAAPVSAQSLESMPGRSGPGTWHVNAVVGPSFGTLGTAPSSAASASYELGAGWSLEGEAGTFRGDPIEKASLVPSATPLPALTTDEKANAYHFNANIRYTAPERNRFMPYVTAGVGTFRTTMFTPGTTGLSGLSGYGRETHSATNFGAGLTYRVNRWLGASADYRMFVFNINEAPRVNRFTTGVSILLR